jgi:pyruvate/2-oxoglutarate dehydrogenase complex dihydrolipoamide acyltransferase (E2) component
MEAPNSIRREQDVFGEQAAVYCLKARAQRHHCLGYGTFSVDHDSLEHYRKEYSRKISPITYMPMYVKATALAIKLNPEANAMLFKKLLGLRIVQFENIDVNLPITRMIGDRPATFIATVRNAAAKSLAEIQDELVNYQKCDPDRSFAIRRFQRFARMPLWQIRLVQWRMTRNPDFYIRNIGTCGVTFLEGDWGEHMFPIAPMGAVFGIGGTHSEPVIRDHTITVRRQVKGTLMVDNYIIPGLTASRLVKDFKELLERGSFVIDELKGTCKGSAKSSFIGNQRDEVV